LGPIGLLAYRTYGLGRSAYRLEPDRLIVEWGARREVVPLTQIKETLAGKDIQANLKPRGIWWPGCMVGRLQTAELGPIEFLATMPQDEQVLVVAEGAALALSPANLEEFTTALAERREETLEAERRTGQRTRAEARERPDHEAERQAALGEP